MTQIQIDTQSLPAEWRSTMTAYAPKAKDALDAVRAGRCPGGEMTGWMDYPRRAGFQLTEEVEAFKGKLNVPYDLVLVIGIGGSYLGTRAVSEALAHAYAPWISAKTKNGNTPIIFLGNNLSEASFIETLDLLDRSHPIVNVISKTGTTTEPSVAFRIVRRYLEQRFGKDEAAARIIATTDARSGALRKVADENGYKSFIVPDNVGGRFSVLTAVGLVPLSLAGFRVGALMDGADALFSELNSKDADEHPALRYALARFAAHQNGKQIEILSTHDPKMLYLAEWWKQLFGESDGKQGKGLFPASLNYTADLHSMGQYVQDGKRNLFETFLSVQRIPVPGAGGVERRLRVPAMTDNSDQMAYLEDRFIEEINAAAFTATRIAHEEGGVPSVEIRVPQLDERAIGALFAFFETACAVGAQFLGVNAFDQPGVDTYKKNLFALMGRPGYEELGAQLRQRGK